MEGRVRGAAAWLVTDLRLPWGEGVGQPRLSTVVPYP